MPSISEAAAAFTLSGKVISIENVPVADSLIEVYDANSHNVVGSSKTNLNGFYSILIPKGTYDISASPPESGGLQKITVTNQIITYDTKHDFTLVFPSKNVTVTGNKIPGSRYIISLVVAILILLIVIVVYIYRKNKLASPKVPDNN